MGRDHRGIVRHLVVVTIVLLATGSGRAYAEAGARQDGLLGVTFTDVASNKPVGKAEVDVRRLDGTRYCSAISDANGTAWVHLAPGAYEICNAVREGYTYEGSCPAVTVGPGATENVTLSLTPDVHGIVRDLTGAPIAGAWVKVVGAGREEAASDWHGKFDIAWYRRCQFRASSAFCLVARHERRNLAALIEIGKETNMRDVLLQPGLTLTGRIVDLEGAGIGGAWVYVTLQVDKWGPTPLGEEQVQADSSGWFAIPAIPPGGRYTIHAYADLYGSKETVVDARTVTDRYLDIGPLALRPARFSVAGRVLDSQGQPVARAQVRGWGDGQPGRLTAQTDADGRFTLASVCAGPVNVRVDADWGDGRHLQAHILADAGDTSLQITSSYAFKP
jgi:protocatechuate 3,4-dioxygenase beta subunit